MTLTVHLVCCVIAILFFLLAALTFESFNPFEAEAIELALFGFAFWVAAELP